MLTSRHDAYHAYHASIRATVPSMQLLTAIKTPPTEHGAIDLAVHLGGALAPNYQPLRSRSAVICAVWCLPCQAK